MSKAGLVVDASVQQGAVEVAHLLGWEGRREEEGRVDKSVRLG
jgi:hypothetical protein